MQITIDVTTVGEVLLADGWHSVDEGTFSSGHHMEVQQDSVTVHNAPCATWMEKGVPVISLLTAVLAIQQVQQVKGKRKTKKKK